jgi:hypothetical protein
VKRIRDPLRIDESHAPTPPVGGSVNRVYQIRQGLPPGLSAFAVQTLAYPTPVSRASFQMFDYLSYRSPPLELKNWVAIISLIEIA